MCVYLEPLTEKVLNECGCEKGSGGRGGNNSILGSDMGFYLSFGFEFLCFWDSRQHGVPHAHPEINEGPTCMDGWMMQMQVEDKLLPWMPTQCSGRWT